MIQPQIDTKAICQAILEVCPDKKVTYRSPDFIIVYGNPLYIEGNHVRGNPGNFDFNSPKEFLRAVCQLSLYLQDYEILKILTLYKEYQSINT